MLRNLDGSLAPHLRIPTTLGYFFLCKMRAFQGCNLQLALLAPRALVYHVQEGVQLFLTSGMVAILAVSLPVYTHTVFHGRLKTEALRWQPPLRLTCEVPRHRSWALQMALQVACHLTLGSLPALCHWQRSQSVICTTKSDLLLLPCPPRLSMHMYTTK